MNNIVLQILPLVIGPLAAFLTELAKKAPIPFEGKTATGIIVALGALSSLLTLAAEIAIAYYSGTLASYDWNHAGQVLVQVVTAILTAAGTYGLAKKAVG